uniref:Uncharacterized protein n=1 Tax=Utricularia reniformis TaxID=192314 RepID=A0A1Y0B1K8_9LAMI|nr:hypothetical protein AEK19_MT1031 [Utricularia reniformis]ART31253.1 hypothetical protein AEK19_MT1031 [Utricularia reniformis]
MKVQKKSLKQEFDLLYLDRKNLNTRNTPLSILLVLEQEGDVIQRRRSLSSLPQKKGGWMVFSSTRVPSCCMHIYIARHKTKVYNPV